MHGLEGDIRHSGNVNSYYDDPHAATGQFDFVLANPPFNVNAVDKERLKEMVGAGRRFPFGLPTPDPLDVIRRQADLLAGMLTETHGSTWMAAVERGLILNQPDSRAR